MQMTWLPPHIMKTIIKQTFLLKSVSLLLGITHLCKFFFSHGNVCTDQMGKDTSRLGAEGKNEPVSPAQKTVKVGENNKHVQITCLLLLLLLCRAKGSYYSLLACSNMLDTFHPLDQHSQFPMHATNKNWSFQIKSFGHKSKATYAMSWSDCTN